MDASYRPSLLLVGCLLALLWWPPGVSSIILCDNGCNNPQGADLEICQPFPDTQREPLRIMGFFPCNVPDFRARGLTVAAQMAVRAVLRNSSILPRYRLELSFNNTMCDRLTAVRSFINQLRAPRYMIIGPGCSTGALPVGEIAPFWNLTQISYTATSISLSDKRRFPHFLRTISSDNASIITVSTIVRKFGWEQVAIVTSRNELYTNLTAVMQDVLRAQGVNVLTERLTFTPRVDDTREIVQQLNTSGARIVVLNMFESFAREIFCNAYKKGMTFPRYVFLSYYQYTEYWWTDPILRSSGHMYDPENCTVRELTDAIFGSLAMEYFPVATPGTEDEPTDVGFTPNQFWSDFLSNITALNYSRSEAIRQAWYTYDAVWAAALALHNASIELENGAVGGRPRSLLDFTYADSEINDVILRAAIGVKFRGVSGNVRINEFGDREPTIQVYQYKFTEVVDPENATLPPPFARQDPDTGDFIFSSGQSVDTVFPSGIPLAVELVLINPALFAVFTALSCLGILFACACLVFNLVFREKKIVKLSSPYLNVVINVGAIFFYVDVILFGVDENIAPFSAVDILCQTRIWVSSIGFTLFFGTILVKTWRVYYIFRSIKLKKKPIKDWMLFVILAVLVAVDVVVLGIVMVWALRLDRRLVPREGGLIPQFFDVCTSDGSGIWIPILLVYKSLFLLVGLFLASQTFNVKIKKLRDSKLIVTSVFSITVISIVITLVAFLLTNNPDATYSIIGLFILLLVTGILILLFVTRMIELYKNPSGDIELSTKPKSEPLSNHLTQPNGSSEDSAKIAQLRETIRSLQTELDMLKETTDLGHDQLHANSKAELLALEDKQTDEQKSNLTEEPSYVRKSHHLDISGSLEQNGGSHLVTENSASAGVGVELTAVVGTDADLKADISEKDIDPALPSEHVTTL